MDAGNWGKYANNMKTLLIQEAVELEFDERLTLDVTIPNIDNFPHKSRCIAMVDTLAFATYDNDNLNVKTRNLMAEDFPELWSCPVVGVSIDGIGVMNSYGNKTNQNSIIGLCPLHTEKSLSTEHSDGISYVFRNTGSIHTCGVLCQSPFGKSLRVQFVDCSNIPDGQRDNNSQFIKSERRERTVQVVANHGGMAGFDIPITVEDYGGINNGVKLGDEVYDDGGDLLGRVVGKNNAGTQITLHQQVVVAADDVLTVKAPTITKTYSVSVNLKLLYIDDEDMKQV
eukprot:SAG22_NODE_540_length_9301_cov_422.312758_5_plen_284_part_00